MECEVSELITNDTLGFPVTYIFYKKCIININRTGINEIFNEHQYVKLASQYKMLFRLLQYFNF
jgi:hypothetical protein